MRMKSGKAEFDSFCSAVDEDTNCQDSLEYVIGQLKVIGTHIIGFWKKIIQNERPRRRPNKVMDVTEERVSNLSDFQTPTATADDDKNNIYMSVEHIVRKLVAVGTHIKGFWSEIVQIIKNPERPQNITNEKEEEVPYLYDSQTPTAIMDDKICPSSKVKARGPDNNVQRDSSLKQNAAMGIYDNSNAGSRIDCISETESLSLGPLQIIPDSTIKCETSGEVNLNTEVAGDQQAVNVVPSTESSKSDGSIGRVDSDGVLSFTSIGSFSSEGEFSYSDYLVL